MTQSGSLRRGCHSVILQEFLDNWEQLAAADDFWVQRTPLNALASWSVASETGNLVHSTGRFFSIEGLHVHTDSTYFGDWTQPIINQPEIGLLGILVKFFDGRLHCLMQAKMEPGNINKLQLSPTVQATRSNYTRVHKGAPTNYLEYFTGRCRGTVIVDVLQSEQGAWFYHKRNRNMVVEVFDDVDVYPGFYWLRLDQIAELMRIDNFVNMDSRTVLSCLPYTDPAYALERHAGDSFTRALTRSFAHGHASDDTVVGLLSWFTEVKAQRRMSATPIPLNRIKRWVADEMAIYHETGKFFQIVGVSVASRTREVANWSQPLIHPCAKGNVVFFARNVDGVIELLTHARVEAGYLDVVELGPTLQCTAENYADVPIEHRPAFLNYIENVPPESIRFNNLQSEEGGRFYHAQNRYMVVEVGTEFTADVPPNYRWIPVGQLAELLRHSNYVNVQARSLIAVLRSLCWRA